jgi:hypothetical protein
LSSLLQDRLRSQNYGAFLFLQILKDIYQYFDQRNMKARYYEFWIISSRGTDETTIRRYPSDMPQDEESLKEDVEEWTSHFGATQVSENCWSYGWREIKGRDLPKDRKDALKHHQKAHAVYNVAKKAVSRAANLLRVFPFNGAQEP